MRKVSSVRLWGWVAVLAILLALPGGLVSARRVVYVQATFMDEITLDESTSIPAKIKGDGKGPYLNARYLTCQIFEGELQLIIDAKSGRRTVFIFDDRLANPSPGAICTEMPPDTECVPNDGRPDEPVTYASFLTHLGSGYTGPHVDLLAMKDGDVADISFWAGFNTNLRTGFYACFDVDFHHWSGVVQVSAKDMTGDGIVDRWIFTTRPSSTDFKLNLFRAWMVKNQAAKCDLGNFSMPFALVLDRLN